MLFWIGHPWFDAVRYVENWKIGNSLGQGLEIIIINYLGIEIDDCVGIINQGFHIA